MKFSDHYNYVNGQQSYTALKSENCICVRKWRVFTKLVMHILKFEIWHDIGQILYMSMGTHRTVHVKTL